MIWFLALLAAGQTAAPPPPPPPARPPGPPPARPAPDPAMTRMVALYDEVCLQAFPDDGAVDRLMEAKGAVSLSPEEVRVTFQGDPGRGWLLKEGERHIQIMLELPPFHACSVRRTLSPGFGIFEYRTAADAFKATRQGFVPVQEEVTESRGIRIRAQGEHRQLPDGRTEALLIIDQQVSDPARRARGEVGVDIRFVHQIVDASAG